MKTVTLRGTPVVTTSLGYGCAQLLRVASARGRARLLAEAYDAGIRHFDVARSYGFGAAEEELGKFARGRRDRLVIATKFGIDVGSGGRVFRAVQGVPRRLVGLFPWLRRAARNRAGVLLAPRRYDAAKARESLEASLRALRTDYVDLFLLHEPTLEAVLHGDVLPFLVAAREAGTIRAFGVSGALGEVERISARMPELAPLAQFPSDAITRAAEKAALPDGTAIVTYGPFSAALERIVSHLGRDAATARRWRDEVHADCADPEVVALLLLRYALGANPRGAVVFATTKPERLRRLAGAADGDVGGSANLGSFLARLAEDPPP